MAAAAEAPRPPLKWAGGKRWQVPHLRPLWTAHAHRRLVEPFCGGLAVTLGLAPAHALLNDANPHLINFYRWLQKGLVIEIEMANDQALFYRHRDRFNDLLASRRANSREAAALFYYLNRTGLQRPVPVQPQRVVQRPVRPVHAHQLHPRLLRVSRRVRGVDASSSRDMEAVPLEPGDFVYADPPYDVEFRSYAKDGFDWEHQERTAAWLARHRGPCVLMNQATRRILDLYRSLGYEVRFLDAPRRISCNGDRTPAREVLALRNV